MRVHECVGVIGLLRPGLDSADKSDSEGRKNLSDACFFLCDDARCRGGTHQ